MTKAGYEIGRDDFGLTKREREVFEALKTGAQFNTIASELGVTKQRVDSIVKSLVRKGRVLRLENGGCAVVVKR